MSFAGAHAWYGSHENRDRRGPLTPATGFVLDFKTRPMGRCPRRQILSAPPSFFSPAPLFLFFRLSYREPRPDNLYYLHGVALVQPRTRNLSFYRPIALFGDIRKRYDSVLLRLLVSSVNVYY